ncbi:MAG: BMC domain-containing protein [Candidatus Tectomicrobia bacterium]|uniref:BMC domain-containing protein n=1 Tax=Tectimicrobiota bacterium TaxID=2528274 RepID=A0A933LPV1_UNCTE|nr:BMC domain-containing protein [Candidatus Tectomicrobia bacterium]
MAQASLGLIETRGFVGLIEAADAILKAANVRVVKYEKVGGGWLAICVIGDVGAVKVAVEAGMAAAQRVGEAKSSVIANPTRDLSSFLGIDELMR